MKKQLLLISSVILLAGCGQPDEGFLEEPESMDVPTVTQEADEVFDEQEDQEGEGDASSLESILEQTHEVDKESSQGGITWVGLKVAPRDELFASGYELWRFDNETEERVLVEFFPLVACSTVDWELNDKEGINLRYTQTPCVDFAELTDIVYDSQGDERLRVMQDSSRAYQFSFEPKNQAEFEVSLAIEGVCEGEVIDINDLPKVDLKAVKITRISPNPWEKVFELPEMQEVQCDQYDDSIINPAMEVAEYDEESINFVISSQHDARIILNSDGGPEVVFN